MEEKKIEEEGGVLSLLHSLPQAAITLPGHFPVVPSNLSQEPALPVPIKSAVKVANIRAIMMYLILPPKSLQHTG